MLDFVFQNGEFSPDSSSFLPDLLTSAIGAGIGAGGALFVYWLQIQRERDLKYINQSTQDKADIEYFQLVLKDTLGFVEVESKVRLDYAAEIKQQPYKSIPLNSYPTLPLIRLEKINHEKMHHLFLSTQGSDATKNFKNIYKYIDYFTNSFTEINSTIDRDTIEIQTLKQDYANQFDSLVDEVSKKANAIRYGVHKGHLSYENDPLYVLLNGIISDFYENRTDTTDLVYYQTQFVRKLTEGLVLGKFIGDSDCLNLALSSKGITFIYSNIKFKIEGLAEYLQRYCSSLQQELKNFTVSVDKIGFSKQLINERWYHIFYTPGQ
ncbi:hypothetical protein [Hymenobacter sp. PAMC 26628]|uniref:hypothetical protein n=1 Tax=Hymenobacter sp. PAMC 26628 TaxID=1484118 RepID=UPI000AE6B664|nr:hypothetical protein [Hymenobacter sp. PAMC 26628]